MKNKRIALMGTALVLAASLVALSGCTAAASSSAPPVPSSAPVSQSASTTSPASVVPAKSIPDASASGEMTGAYTEQRDLTEEDKALFDEVMAQVDNGKTYVPVSVATQVVAGTNYSFAVTVTENGKESKAFVVIFQPLPGQGAAEFVAEEAA